VNLLACAHASVVLQTEAGKAWWACQACATPFAPVVQPQAVDAGPEPEYFSVRQLAERIPYTEGQIRNMMSAGTFLLGVHYDKPQGRVMFRWSAVRAWIRGERKVS
jgi:hypothetical protein